MGMGAITSAAMRALAEKILPELTSQLEVLSMLPEHERTSGDALRNTCTEALELLKTLQTWCTEKKNAPLTDDDATMAMVAEFDEDMLDEIPTGAPAANTAKAAPPTTAGEEMSDEEAAMLLSEMDEPAAPAAAPVSAAKPAAAAPMGPTGGEMSDDEALRLLSEMDGEPTPPTAPPAGTATHHQEMSDNEAMRLLAEMDGAADTPAAPMPPPAPVAASAAPMTAEEMSDAEAQRLLAEMEAMDAPSAPPSASPSAKAPPPRPTAAPAHAVATAAAASGHGSQPSEEVSEIPEWASNEFASDPDMMQDFISNSKELLETLDGKILELEQDPTNKETIEEIFRAAHTLKGAAGMFGFSALERVMHRMENLFDLVRKGKLTTDASIVDVVFQGMDCMRVLLEAVKNGKPCGVKTAPVVHALNLAVEGRAAAATRGASAPSPTGETAASLVAVPAPADPHHHEARHGASAVAEPKRADDAGKGKAKETATIRVDLERLDVLVNLVGELVIDRTRFVSIEEELRTRHAALGIVGNMTETVQLFGRHMNEIQDIIMKIRMVPIGNVFKQFPRVVRDLARGLGKQIDIAVSGESTELDKTLVELIGDPLMHLIRNSCDHGIETLAEREKAGKRPTGTIHLSAQQEGNHIVISIRDDGKGMNTERIRQKGIEKGLIKADAVLSDRDIFNLIFEAGFSTAEKVTNVSGRGVGMDVVRKQIQKLKGMIDIQSTFGRGTTITIHLPLTLAIMQSLLVEAQEEVYAIPLNSVVESIRIQPTGVQKIGDAEVIKLRDRVLPLVYLSDTLKLHDRDGNHWYTMRAERKERARNHDRIFVVVVGSADRRFGIVVDKLLNQQEMVIKPMGPMMRGIPCIAGGAVLGNGEVVLVLDIQELENNFRAKARAATMVA